MNKNVKNTKAELESLRLPELQARYREVVGETTMSPNRKHLIRRIEETLTAQQAGANASESQPQATTDSVAMNVTDTETEQQADVVPIEPATSVEAETTEDVAELSPEQTTTEPGEAAQLEAPQAEPATQESATEHPLDAEQATPAPEAELASTPESAPQAATTAEPAKEKKQRGRFAAMTTEELQTLYTERVGRPSASSHRGYLIWKIREAEKGRVTVGPIQPRAQNGEPKEMKVLPLSLEAATVEKMDEAWRAKGIKSRMEFFRQAIGSYLTQIGATEAAALFTTE